MITKNKHTPGPWICYDFGYGIRIAPADIQDALIPHVAGVQNQIACLKAPSDDVRDWDADWEQLKADANLMTVAPEMLDLLTATLKVIADTRSATFGPRRLEFQFLVEKIETVLKKVGGAE